MKSHAGATTGKKNPWRSYECVGGPHDGLVVSLWKRARNVVLIGPDKLAHEYLDMSVDEMSPILAATAIVGELGTATGKLEYSGWLTAEELRYAKKLADRS